MMKLLLVIVSITAVLFTGDCRDDFPDGGRPDSVHQDHGPQDPDFHIGQEQRNAEEKYQQLKMSEKEILFKSIAEKANGKTCEEAGGKCMLKKTINKKCKGQINKKSKCNKKNELCCISGNICQHAGGKCMPKRTFKKKCNGKLNKKIKCMKKRNACCISELTTVEPHMTSPTAIIGVANSSSSSVEFVIKNSVYYICPDYDDKGQVDRFSYKTDYNNNCIMTFDIMDKEWGYIRHLKSGLHFYIFKMHIKDCTLNFISMGTTTNPNQAYFAIDQLNNRIISLGDRGHDIKLLTKGNYPNMIAGFYRDITPDNDGCNSILDKFGVKTKLVPEFVNTSDPNKEALPYGDLHVLGKWQLVFSVENPIASQSRKIENKVGYSKTKSVTGTLKYVWEVEVSAQGWFLKFSTKASIHKEITKSTSETWTHQTTVTDTFQVEAGHPVAFWQRFFVGEAGHHKAVFQSTIFAHTNSSKIEPPEDYIAYKLN